MEKVFVVTTKYQLCNADMLEVNKFLKENPNYIIKNIVPVMQYDHLYYYGVVITVGEI